MNNNIENKKNKNREDKFFAIRHAQAEYKLNERIISSDNAEIGHDAKNQDFVSDLTPEGKELAKKEAEEFLNNLDSEQDALFFVSSDLVRAVETASIYKNIAKEEGFEVMQPGNIKDSRVEEIGGGEVRQLDSLSLDLKNMLLEFIFHPDKDYLNDVIENKDNISHEVLDQWDEARKIVASDNQGTWGKNYYKHSEAIAKIFPDIRTAEDMYNREFQQLVKLMKFGQKKMEQSDNSKNIKVLAFGHENSFLYFLGKNFKDGSIDNCESIEFQIKDDDTFDVKAKGESKNIKFE